MRDFRNGASSFFATASSSAKALWRATLTRRLLIRDSRKKEVTQEWRTTLISSVCIVLNIVANSAKPFNFVVESFLLSFLNANPNSVLRVPWNNCWNQAISSVNITHYTSTCVTPREKPRNPVCPPKAAAALLWWCRVNCCGLRKMKIYLLLLGLFLVCLSTCALSLTGY